jgi:hypothetical protein
MKVVGLDSLAIDTRFALRLNGQPTAQLTAALEAAVRGWWSDGFDGRWSAGGGFHNLNVAGVDDNGEFNFFVDFGPTLSDPDVAVAELVHRLEQVTIQDAVAVREVVVVGSEPSMSELDLGQAAELVARMQQLADETRAQLNALRNSRDEPPE